MASYGDSLAASMIADSIRVCGIPCAYLFSLAQGMPACSDCTCMLVCASLYTLHTRPRVQRAPGIPCSLRFRRREKPCKPRGIGPRERESISFSRHCERSKAIHSAACGGDGLFRFARSDADRPRRTGHPRMCGISTRCSGRTKSSSRQAIEVSPSSRPCERPFFGFKLTVTDQSVILQA